jgi:hypothetical protein
LPCFFTVSFHCGRWLLVNMSLKRTDIMNMKHILLLLFFGLSLVAFSQENPSTGENEEKPVYSSTWKILNDSTIYPFWMAVVPRGAWDFDETITTEQWNGCSRRPKRESTSFGQVTPTSWGLGERQCYYWRLLDPRAFGL